MNCKEAQGNNWGEENILHYGWDYITGCIFQNSRNCTL